MNTYNIVSLIKDEQKSNCDGIKTIMHGTQVENGVDQDKHQIQVLLIET